MKKFLYLILFLSLSLFSCTDSNKIMKEDFDRTGQELRIVVHTYPNQKALIRATSKYGSTYEVGMAVWSKSDNLCEIHVIEARYQEDKQFETWGHELAHCVHGTFH